MDKKDIAILGSNSHIAKGLINSFLREGRYNLHLYTRSPDKTNSFLGIINVDAKGKFTIHKGYRDFVKYHYDIIINCVGVGTFNKLQGDYSRYFSVTEEYDNLVINYLQKDHFQTIYISLSSGAIYGKNFSAPVNENTLNCIKVNQLTKEDCYAIARLNAEAKHRSLGYLRIIDLRLFSYFSRFIDLKDGYFITEAIDCILKKKVFITDNTNIIRDYVHPKDLFSMIIKCMKAGVVNDVFDVISSKPVSKQEILDYFLSEYGLKYRISRIPKYRSATGSKDIYYSDYIKAREIGYKPLFSSIDTIKQESKHILNLKVV